MPDGVLKPQRESFSALCACIDIVLAAKRGSASPGDAAGPLRAALEHHLTLHQRAYGSHLVRPKHHWNLDVADQLVRDSCVLDSFIIERRHLQVKWVADLIKNTRRFELSVLAGVTNTAFATAKSLVSVVGGLVGSTAALPGFAEVLIADRLDFAGHRIAVGDVTLHGGLAGQVVACASEANLLYVIVEVWEAAGRLSCHSSRWRATTDRAIWYASALDAPIAWYLGDDGLFTIVGL